MSRWVSTLTSAEEEIMYFWPGSVIHAFKPNTREVGLCEFKAGTEFQAVCETASVKQTKARFLSSGCYLVLYIVVQMCL